MVSAMADEPQSEPDPRARVTDEALLGLEQRLQRASEAAERLLADAVARVGDSDSARDAEVAADGWGFSEESSGASGGPRAAGASSAAGASGASGWTGGGADPRQTPPAGWQQPGGERPRSGILGDDGELLLALVASLRDRIPPDLQRRLAEAVREVLLALRALIDWYLERTEHRRNQPTEVRDIPIL